MACDEKNTPNLPAPLALFDSFGPSPHCPACIAKRLHHESEERLYHPYARHGYTREQGFTHPGLAAKLPDRSKYPNPKGGPK